MSTVLVVTPGDIIAATVTGIFVLVTCSIVVWVKISSLLNNRKQKGGK